MNNYSKTHLEVLNELREDCPVVHLISLGEERTGREEKAFDWENFINNDYIVVYDRNTYHSLFVSIEDSYFVGHDKVFIISVSDKPHESFWKYIEGQPLVEVKPQAIMVIKWEEVE